MANAVDRDVCIEVHILITTLNVLQFVVNKVVGILNSCFKQRNSTYSTALKSVQCTVQYSAAFIKQV